MNRFFCNKCAGEELVIAASTLSTIIAKNLELEELETLASFVTVLGDCLDAIATQRAIYKDLCTTPKNTDSSNSTNSKQSTNSTQSKEQS